MLGLDEHLAHLAGGSVALALAIAVLLGLRHATDPDHLTAVTTIVLSDERHGARRASRLGLAWGLGHATTLVALGLPAVLVSRELPGPVQRAAEVAVGLVIAALAVRLLLATRGAGGGRASRTPRAAYGIGLLHGAGGSAGVAVLLLSAMPDARVAVLCLVLFAAAAGASMALASAAFGQALGARAVTARLARLAPVFATASLLFGLGYATAALT